MNEFFKGMVVMLLYNGFGLIVLMMACTNANGEGKAEVKDIILWQFFWPAPSLIAICRGIINIGKGMLAALPKKDSKKGEGDK